MLHKIMAHGAHGLSALALVLTLHGFSTRPAEAADSYKAATPQIATLVMDEAARRQLPADWNDKPMRMIVFPNVPFTMTDDTGALYGAGIDMGQAIAATLGIPLEVNQLKDLATTKVSLQGGRFDISSGPILDTEAAEKDFFILPWAAMTTGILFPAGTEFSDILETCGKTIAIAAGSLATEKATKVIAENCLAKGLSEPRVTAFGGQEATIIAVSSKRQDMALMAGPSTLYIGAKQPEVYKGVSIESDIFGIGLYSGFALPKGDMGLASAILAALKAMQQNGTYDAIMAQYGLENIKVEHFAINPITQ